MPVSVLLPYVASGYTNSDNAKRRDDSDAVATHSWAAFAGGTRELYLTFPVNDNIPRDALIRRMWIVSQLRVSGVQGTPVCTLYLERCESGTLAGGNQTTWRALHDRTGNREQADGYYYGTTTLTRVTGDTVVGSYTRGVSLSVDTDMPNSSQDLTAIRPLLNDQTCRMRVQWYRTAHATAVTCEVGYVELHIDWVPNGAAMRRRHLAGTVGGTTYSQGVSGTVTPAAVLSRKPAKVLAGSVTPAGTLGTLKAIVRAMAGTITPAAVLVRRPGKQLAADITPTSAVTRRTGKTMAGTVTPSGTVGTLKAIVRAMAGAIAPAGVLVRRPGKALAGTVAPAAGLVRRTAKTFAATVTPAATLAALKTFLRTMTGSVAPAGSLVRRPGRVLSGAVTPAGSIVRAVSRTLAGAVAPVGTVVKRAAKTLAGAVTPAGTLSTLKAILRAFAGTITPSAVLTRRAGKTAAGTVTPTATVTKRTGKTLAGTVTPTSSLARQVGKTLAGTVTAAATLLTQIVGGGSTRNWTWTVRGIRSAWATRGGPRSRWTTGGPDQ